MPYRKDIKKIMIIGSGPIVIGQASEFDYSGTQAVKALREEGYETVLINSNPATIMTDPEMVDRVYIEPITLPYLTTIIKKERPDALLPTVGGQTALNAAIELHEKGILDQYGVEMIGANAKAIQKAEDRSLFKKAMKKIGIDVPRSELVQDLDGAKRAIETIDFPVILRPSFTLGGSGSGICYSMESFPGMISKAFKDSPVAQVLIEESVLGWKEFELEVMRDMANNVVIICSIENIDPMGVHTGDSITVAPQQTLSDKEYQNLRNMSIQIMQEIGVETGGSNIQFAVNPENGKVMVIEMNPRVSRSSALASKATGFAIARIAAKLSVGYLLPEIMNEITEKTPACFEPTIDYIVTKIPRFNFEKFPGTSRTLGTQMHSVGEAMALGRTFSESFQKALRSLEVKKHGWGSDGNLEYYLIVEHKKEEGKAILKEFWKEVLSTPNDQRIFYIREAFLNGMSVQNIHEMTQIDPWFLYQMQKMIHFEQEFKEHFDKEKKIDRFYLKKAKQMGYSDLQIAVLTLHIEYKKTVQQLLYIKKGSREYLEKLSDLQQKIYHRETEITFARDDHDIHPVFKRVDTCAAEFESYTPYLYSTYEEECESQVSEKEKVIILGGGPNRIGQGIEFDYCCCHASFSLQEMKIESIMVNSNPETVSTDHDSSDRLYFEPLSLESILSIYKKEMTKGKLLGVIIQFGGQTPLSLSNELEKKGVKILGTSPLDIRRAENRSLFNELIQRLDLRQPIGEVAINMQSALEAARKIGYPLLIRPSYVLGGRAMAIVYNDKQLQEYMEKTTEISADQPVLIDQFLQNAIEVDVDALCDQEEVVVAGIMEHIEQAGVHSGDSACILPPKNISLEILEEIKQVTKKVALELKVKGLINIQFAIQNNLLYILEVNPRASRTIPFVSKAIGVPLAKIATKIIMGKKLNQFQSSIFTHGNLYNVKEVVLPFKKFSGVDTILGPEMKSTGEVMGIGKTPSEAFYKAQEAAGFPLPSKGTIFISVNDISKPFLEKPVERLLENHYNVIATKGTSDFFSGKGLGVNSINKVHEGSPHIVNAIEENSIHFILNIPTDHITMNDALEIRLAAIKYNIPYVTTLAAALEAFEGMMNISSDEVNIYPLAK